MFPFKVSQDWINGKKLYGNLLAQEFYEYLKKEVNKYKKKPGLAAIIVGNNPASNIYVAHKEKKAKELDYYSHIIKLPEKTSQVEIIQEIEKLNNNSLIHGILVQLPLPQHINESIVLSKILPEKDADGFHYNNIGKLWSGIDTVVPCTPLGILFMLKNIPTNLEGSHAVVIGRSNIVGKPMANLILQFLNCTVSICHSKTKNLEDFTKNADLVVLATGKRNIISPENCKKGSILIDIGIHRINNKVCGDIDHEDFLSQVSYITPVPKGVGPITIAMLMYNTYKNFLKTLS